MKDIEYITEAFAPAQNKAEATVKLGTNEVWLLLRDHYGHIEISGEDIHTALTRAKYKNCLVVKDGKPTIVWLMKER